MNLTMQEYYDLVVRHSNNIYNRPRCPECKILLKYNGRFNIGYWVFCSRNCNASYNLRYQYKHLDQYPTREAHLKEWYSYGCKFEDLWRNPKFRSERLLALTNMHKNYHFRTKFDYYRFLKTGDADATCYFYLAINFGRLKLGVTSNPDFRRDASYLNGVDYSTMHLLYKGSRFEIATLEAIIKLRNEGKDGLHQLGIERENHANA